MSFSCLVGKFGKTILSKIRDGMAFPALLARRAGKTQTVR